MNQGRIWCVVNPTVGLPLLIGSVAVTSLVVHASVMTHTTWMSNYWQGDAAKTAAADTLSSPVASNVVKTGDGYVITVKVAPDTATKLSSLEDGAASSTLDGAAVAAK
ncbi:light-harvesting protein [Aestuariivirga sp.]|uniref:light-harvesting protein n=1 Tax=Aestuariivirga sp. TaxID=2650926 RepID=UPI003BAD2C87